MLIKAKWNLDLESCAVSHGGLSISYLLKADDVILFSSASTKHCGVVHI
jgi:hypothetical protein